VLTCSRFAVAVAVMSMATGLAAAKKPKVEIDHSKTADFTTFKTYRWLPPSKPQTTIAPGAPGDPRPAMTALEPQVRAAVDRQLAAKGLRRVDQGDADLLVADYIAVEGRLDTAQLGTEYAYTTDWALPIPRSLGQETMTPTTFSKYVEEGSIVIDLISTANERAVWRGNVHAPVNRMNSPRERQARVEKAISQLFEKYPPK
jgi:Domain of unknown function (DUF4136)